MSANTSKGGRFGPERPDEGPTLAVLRVSLLVVFVLGAVGIGAELLLLGHTEGPWQWAPIGLLAASLVALLWSIVGRRATILRLFQVTMVMCVLSAGLGQWFHYQGNQEFELEMYPSRQGFELFTESLTGATPTLAPGAMLQLGLLGLAYTYRHPHFGPTAVAPSPGDANDGNDDDV